MSESGSANTPEITKGFVAQKWDGITQAMSGEEELRTQNEQGNATVQLTQELAKDIQKIQKDFKEALKDLMKLTRGLHQKPEHVEPSMPMSPPEPASSSELGAALEAVDMSALPTRGGRGKESESEAIAKQANTAVKLGAVLV